MRGRRGGGEEERGGEKAGRERKGEAEGKERERRKGEEERKEGRKWRGILALPSYSLCKNLKQDSWTIPYLDDYL